MAESRKTEFTDQLRRCEQEYRRIKDRIQEEVGFICEGSLLERWTLCGKPNCCCRTDDTNRHGPYYQLSWKEKGKTVSRRLSEQEAKLYRELIKNRRLLESTLQEMHRVSRQATPSLLHRSEHSKTSAKTPKRSRTRRSDP